MVTALSLGGAGIGGVYGDASDDGAIETVHYAIERGINYVDTSPLYGESERRVGLALEGGLRENVVLSTKTGTHPDRRGDYSWDGTYWSVENSLRLLKTDHIDLLLVHDPTDIEPVFAPRGALEALEQLKAEKVVGHIGLGQRNHEFHRRAIQSGRFDVILTFNDYHPLRTTAAGWLLPLARQHDVGVLNGAVLGFGLLAGDEPLRNPARRYASKPELEKAQMLYEWCRARGISMQALAFQFSLRQTQIDCTLTGAKSKGELQSNLDAASAPLPDKLWDELDALGLAHANEMGDGTE
jgi:aryl-alcohol dehydrogenase-like predicted oxidoreductase